MKILQRNKLIYNFWQHNFSRKQYSFLEEEDIRYFRSILPQHSVITDESAI